MPIKGRVKWLHAPGHANSTGPAVIRRAHQSFATVIDWTEMYHNLDDLKAHCPGYNHFIGEAKHKDKRNRVVNHDVVISTTKKAKVLHDEEFFVDRELKFNIKYHPERWGKARVINYDGYIILIIAWHPQPGALHNLKIVLPHYKRSVDRVEAVHDRLVKEFEPDLVLMGGDLQLGKGNKAFSPNKMANRLGLRSANHKIDWQMWSKDWAESGAHTIDPSTINSGMDHYWMVRTLLER